jgi:hypothetical protein
MSRVSHFLLISIILVNLSNQGNMIQKTRSERKILRTEWTLSDLTGKTSEGVQIRGNPGIIKFRNKKAISFNGSSDAVFLDSMPLAGCEQFTIEIIFKPFAGGNFEQRFLHIGEVQGDRVLLELRSTQTGWYFDAFIKVGDQDKALIDPQLLHPFDQWYHLAYIVDHGRLETYINGKKELGSNLGITPLKAGKTSIGVRQNEVSWFKGAIYKIRITPEALKPESFMKF